MRHFIYIFLFCTFSYGQTLFLTDDDIKAFPGALGFGQDSNGGRNGAILHINTLSSSSTGSYNAMTGQGSGSLKWAVDQTFARTIVFDISGTIDLGGTTFTIEPDSISILAQTAPGGGITLVNGNIRTNGTSHAIFRFLRVRDAPEDPGGLNAVSVINNKTGVTSQHIIWDHASITGGSDENWSVGASGSGSSVRNVTLQNSIIAEGKDSPLFYATLLGEQSFDISMIQNLWINNGNRVPEHTYGDGGSFEFVNNLLYNNNRCVTMAYGTSIFDSVGNVFKSDSDFPPGQANHVHQLNSFENPDGIVTGGDVWESDNIEIGVYTNPNGMTNSNWGSNGATGRGITTSPYTPVSSSLVEDLVINNVGPSVLFTDSYDARLFTEYTNNTGVQGGVGQSAASVTSVNHTAGYDTDGDGLSDAYEDAQTAAYGGATDSVNPNDRPAQAKIADGTTIDQTGVTNYATTGYTHMDIFAADLAGDWDSFTVQGSGTTFNASKSSQAIQIAN